MPTPCRPRTAACGALVLTLVVTLLGCRDGTGPGGPATPPGQPDRATGDWETVDVAGSRTCALDRAGRAYCWGAAIGATPQPVLGAAGPFTALTLGAGHQCALTAAGEAYCWGANNVGQLGTGEVADAIAPLTATPQPVRGGLAFRSLSGGLNHTCGVTTEGGAYCWGEGLSGALGSGALPPGCDPAAERFCPAPAPVPVAGGHRFAQLSAGRSFTCGVTVEGATFCWGDNVFGALGAPDVPVGCGGYPGRRACVRDAPVLVAGGQRFAQVDAGGLHACAVTTAGAAYCWGIVTDDRAIGAAELGNERYTGYFGNQRGSRVPVPVEGGLVFRAVSAAARLSCGLTADGRAVCWGSNNYAQMGISGIEPVFSTAPRLVWMPAASASPAVGEGFHACAPTTSGRIFCWGDYNFSGELGSEPVSEAGNPDRHYLRGTPTPVGGSDRAARRDVW